MRTDSDTSGTGGPVPGDGPARLLDEYRAGRSFFFASPTGTLLAHDVDATVPKTACASRQEVLPGRVADFLRSAQDFGRTNPMVVGAVPFSDSLPAHLVLPSEVVHTRAMPMTAPGAGRAQRSREYDITPVPSPAEYEREVRRVLRRIDRGFAEKVVLARFLELRGREPIDARSLLRELALGDPGGCTFAVDLPRRGEDGSRGSFGPHPELRRTLVGGSAGILVSRNGNRVVSKPVIRSVPRSDDAAEDQRRMRALLESDVGRYEHDVMTESIVDSFGPLCADLDVPDSPAVVSTATRWYLTTEITGELRASTTSLELALALHPAPAVCGTPVGAARAVIREAEPFERGYYAGLVGWCDAAGDGEWTVATRCAEVEYDVLRLYAAAAVVSGADPASELAETSAHFRSDLSAMGLPVTAS